MRLTKADVERVTKIVYDFKSQPCADCNEVFPVWVMDPDHVRGTKRFRISAAFWSHAVRDRQAFVEAVEELGSMEAAVVTELAKCDPVCKNCHAMRSHLRREQRKAS